MWNYTSQNDWGNISLHDCRIIKITTSNNDAVFEFNDNGFWITENNKHNPYKRTLRTDKSELILKNCRCTAIKITAKQRLLGKFLRKKNASISWEEFCLKINSKEWLFEFLTETHESGQVIYEGELHFDKKPYYMDCILEFDFDEKLYCWNKICEDRPW